MADGKVVIETDLDASGIKAGLSKLSGIAQSGIKGTLTAIASAGTALAGLGGAAIKLGQTLKKVCPKYKLYQEQVLLIWSF